MQEFDETVGRYGVGDGDGIETEHGTMPAVGFYPLQGGHRRLAEDRCSDDDDDGWDYSEDEVGEYAYADDDGDEDVRPLGVGTPGDHTFRPTSRRWRVEQQSSDGFNLVVRTNEGEVTFVLKIADEGVSMSRLVLVPAAFVRYGG